MHLPFATTCAALGDNDTVTNDVTFLDSTNPNLTSHPMNLTNHRDTTGKNSSSSMRSTSAARKGSTPR